MESNAPHLNEHQARHLLASCQYIDGLLRDLDMILASSAAPAAFEKHINDTTPVERGVMRDYLVRLRLQLVRSLAVFGMSPAPPSISTRHAVRTSLGFVEIAVDELRPDDLRGYGSLDPSADTQINGMVEELLSVIRQFEAFLSRSGTSLKEQIDGLGDRAPNRQLLSLLGEIIERYALLEFRPVLEMVLDRAKRPRYEIAVFGRVSTGKSSLLNHLLGTEFLPVGVTPITAVPTRLTYGPAPRVLVSFADAMPRILNIDALPEFATESSNPANKRRVTQLTVECPAPLLRDGVVFVDTPGLGSLASHGTSEALAYLPRCDLAVLLTDASAVVSENDVATTAQLHAAGIPALIVVSKADLLSEAQRASVLDYTSRALREQLGWAPVVSAVSTVPSHEGLLRQWLETVLRPRLADHQRQLSASINRKIDQLADDVARTLTRRAGGRSVAPDASGEREALATELRDAASRFEAARALIEAIVDGTPRRRDNVFAIAAHHLQSTPVHTTATALAAALDDVARAQAAQVREILESLEVDVHATLDAVARALGQPAPETAARATEIPRAELGDTVAVGISRAWALLSPGLAERHLARALVRANGQPLSDALDAYARLLADWAKRALRALRARFDADADRYRTWLGPAAASDLRGPTNRIAADLEALATARENDTAASG